MYNEGFRRRIWKFSILALVILFCGSGYLASASALSNSLNDRISSKPIGAENKREGALNYHRIHSLNVDNAKLLYGAAAFQIDDKISVGLGSENGSGSQEGTAIFSGLEVDETGTYWLDIYYLPDHDDLYFDISVNGRNQVAMCPAERSWYTVGVRRIEVELQEGSNELAICRKGKYVPKLYKIEILSKTYIDKHK